MPDRAPEAFACGKSLGLARHARVMGILNVTPDSFSDSGRCFGTGEAVRHGISMAAAGAAIIDVGGESTRPGAQDVPADEECRRIVPVIRELARRIKIPLSVDTRKSAVAEAAVAAGASIINDVSGLRYDPAIAAVAARTRAALIIMHMRGSPRTMQRSPRYGDVTKECMIFLRKAMAVARKAGVADRQIIVDPGIGFGKTCAHNLTLLQQIERFSGLGRPVCVGVSRKSFIGAILDTPEPRSRIAGSLAAAAAAVLGGAQVIRAHDVRQTYEAVRIAECIREGRTI